MKIGSTVLLLGALFVPSIKGDQLRVTKDDRLYQEPSSQCNGLAYTAMKGLVFALRTVFEALKDIKDAATDQECPNDITGAVQTTCAVAKNVVTLFLTIVFILGRVVWDIAANVADTVCANLDPYSVGANMEEITAIHKNMDTMYKVLADRAAESHKGLNAVTNVQLPNLAAALSPLSDADKGFSKLFDKVEKMEEAIGKLTRDRRRLLLTSQKGADLVLNASADSDDVSGDMGGVSKTLQGLVAEMRDDKVKMEAIIAEMRDDKVKMKAELAEVKAMISEMQTEKAETMSAMKEILKTLQGMTKSEGAHAIPSSDHDGGGGDDDDDVAVKESES